MDDLLTYAELPRSSFYYHCGKLDAPKQERKDDALEVKIQQIYNEHNGCYGYRRIRLALAQQGIICNHKRVSRIMRQLGLKAVIRCRKPYNSYPGAAGKVVENKLNRQFSSTMACGEKWVTDITQFNVGGQKLYLSPILDLHNREIVSYTMGTSPDAQLVVKMLKQAVTKLGKDEKPMIHSDQGSQYRSEVWHQLLDQLQFEKSMSHKGNCWDNAVMENFFGTLKSEMFYRKKFRSIQELKLAIDEYIEYYNHRRISLYLNGLSPVQFRTQSIRVLQ